MAYKQPLTIMEALNKDRLEIHTSVGIKTLRRPQNSRRWSIAEEAYLHIASLKGYKIYETKRKVRKQAVPA